MSDPVTNVEIEDVLSSIRRLVSDGDKARTRDPAPADPPSQGQDHSASAEPESVESDDPAPQAEAVSQPDTTSRLVLTPAFLVQDAAPSEPNEAVTPSMDDSVADDVGEPVSDTPDQGETTESFADDDAASQDEPVDVTEHADAAAEDQPASLDNAQEDEEPADAVAETVEVEPETDEDEAPLQLGEMVWGDTDQPAEPKPATATDRSSLVATIAELEAAVGGADEYEPDGSETAGQTIAWPGRTRAPLHEVEDADVEPEADEEEPADQAADDMMSDAEEVPARAADAVSPTPEAPETETESASDRYDDDDLDGLMDAGGVTIDEAALRDLVAEVVREELTGPMGERITRNVRKLVRREIYRILSSQEFD